MNMVKSQPNFSKNSFAVFHFKMKRLKKALAQWSRETFGNIFQEIATFEEVIKVIEEKF